MQNQPIALSPDAAPPTPEHVLNQIFTYEFNQNLFDYLDAEDSENLSKILPLLYQIHQERAKTRHFTYDNRFLDCNPLEFNFIHKAILYIEYLNQQPESYVRHVLSRPYLSELEIHTNHISHIERLRRVERPFLLEHADELISVTNLSRLNKFTLQNQTYMKFHTSSSKNYTNHTIGFLLTKAQRLRALRIKNTVIDFPLTDRVRSRELHTLQLKDVCVIRSQIAAIARLLLNHKETLRTFHLCIIKRGAYTCFLNTGYLVFRALNKLEKLESLHITYAPNLKLRNIFKLRNLKEFAVHFNLDSPLTNIRKIYIFAKTLSKIHEDKISIKIILHGNDPHQFNSFSPSTSLHLIRHLTQDHPIIHCQYRRDH